MKRVQRSIVVWPGSLHLQNNGDVAMLQTTVRRLKKLCPQRRIRVFVQRPDLLERYCPDAEPLDPIAVDLRRCRSLMPETFLRILPDGVREYIHRKQTHLLAQSSTAYRLLAHVKARLKRERGDLGAAFKLLAHTDAIVSTGGGFINDGFPSTAERIMDDLLLGASLSIPTAMFGQGLGPISDSTMLHMAEELFPKLTVIGVREGRQSYGLALKWAGGASPRIRVTGDDAIEAVYNERRSASGDALGVNIRVASYSGVNRGRASQVAKTLRSAAANIGAPLAPIIISRHPKDSDAKSLQELFGNDLLPCSEAEYDSPEKTASAVGRCRVVVTGSYHAGVFALAQGIPVIGLAASEYYEDKFLGLADQFGCGVEMVRLDDPCFDTQLLGSVHNMWHSAPTWRERMLRCARNQIELSERTYSDFAAVLDNR